jgi:hypothetical protein
MKNKLNSKRLYFFFEPLKVRKAEVTERHEKLGQ